VLVGEPTVIMQHVVPPLPTGTQLVTELKPDSPVRAS
jgi:hypothetical protein